MNIILPPKRFEDDCDPKYDPIRHKSWFGALRERRAKLPMLKQASQMILNGKSQKAAAEEFSIDERELRDYIAFYSWSEEVDKRHQIILDRAYVNYCALNAERSIKWHLEKEAPHWGLVPRHVTEMWEINPAYLPTGYQFK